MSEQRPSEPPLPHRWVGPRGPVKWEHCEICMTIRRRDDSNAPCRGEAAPIELRTSNPMVDRLRECARWNAAFRDDCNAAAAEIERLQAELDTTRTYFNDALRLAWDQRDRAQAEVARLRDVREAAQELIDYEKIGGPDYLHGQERFDALSAALAAGGGE